MSRCPTCLTFEREGIVCPGCRSVRRIRDLFAGGFLLKSQEARALEALRTCVGVLTDLAEVAAPILAKEKGETGPAEPELVGVGPAGPLGLPVPPVVGKLVTEESEQDRKAKEEHVEETEPLAEVKEHHEEAEAPEARSASARDSTEVEGATKKKKRKKREGTSRRDKPRERRRRKVQKEKSEEPEAEQSAEHPSAEAVEPDFTPAQPATGGEELDTHGLKPAPKPQAHPYFPRLLPPPPPPRRPRSPDHPPPHREGRRDQRPTHWGRPPRSRTPPKRPRGSKGAKHRQRGIERRAAGYR